MADFSSLVKDVHDLFQKDIEAFSVSISHDIKEPSLRMSNLGSPLRQLYYTLTGAPKEDLSGETYFKFTYGNILEAMFMDLAILAGHDIKDRQREIELSGVKGHIDGSIDNVLVDIKSCSPASFRKFQTGQIEKEDPFGYVYQLSSYWSCLPEYDRAAFIAINKVSGEICVYELTKDKRKSEADVRSRITEIRQAVDRGVTPERCYEPQPLSKSDKSGNLVLGVGCSYCGFKFHCHSDANDGQGLKTFNYSNGIKFFTHINKLPRVDEIKPFKVQQEEEHT